MICELFSVSPFEPIQTDYGRYNFYENPPYHKQPQGPNNWQAMHKPHGKLYIEYTRVSIVQTLSLLLTF